MNIFQARSLGGWVVVPALCGLAIALQAPSAHAQQTATSQGRAAATTTPSSLPSHLRQVNETGNMTLMVKQGNLLRLSRAATNVLVADPSVASFQVPSPTSLFVYGEKVGSTTLYALDENDAVIAAIKVTVEYDLQTLIEQIRREVPGADIQIEPTANESLIVRGKVRTPLQAKQIVETAQAFLDGAASSSGGSGGSGGGGRSNSGKIINQLKVEQSAQVNIQVRVVEMSRTMTHELGFNWSAVLNPKFGLFGADGVINIGMGGSTVFDAANVGRGISIGGSFIPRNGRIGSLSGLLTAMQGEGMATVLAEPNLTAMSGETASFAAGGKVPVVTITGQSVNIDYEPYGVIVRMTPTLLSSNRISLHVAPEVSELTSVGAVQMEGFSIPAFTVRRADTTVELASGQSFALAGMLRSNSGKSIEGVPGLRNIPLLGRLFEHEATTRDETELVILVTAFVVDPVSPGDLQIPGQGMPEMDSLMPKQAAAGYLY